MVDPAKHDDFSVVYGPVESWRLGRSLGIDLLGHSSTCSLNCVYCQLGVIENPTTKRQIFVPTETVLAAVAAADWQSADVITFSGSGEPTLAQNLGEVIAGVRQITKKPIVVLTNATLFDDPVVRRELARADQVFCKLDAVSDSSLVKINRPVGDYTVVSLIAGIRQFRREYSGNLAIQTMLLSPLADDDLEAFADSLRAIRPDELQLNLPTRAIPLKFIPAARGNSPLASDAAVVSRQIRPLGTAAYTQIARRLGAMSGIPVRFRHA